MKSRPEGVTHADDESLQAAGVLIIHLKGGMLNMSYYISADGGGSKLNVMLFDEKMNLLGKGRSGGVNLTQTSLEDCRANVCDSLNQLFAGGVPDRVETLYITFVGPKDVFIDELRSRTHLERVVINPEGEAGMWAGRLRLKGVLALSGTGSGISIYNDEGRISGVGGWGPILGDEGSGSWIGQQALRAAVRFNNGWGPVTLLREMIMTEWEITDPWDMIRRVHKAAAPFRKVASLTRVVGRAADAGDAVALGILMEAAHYMALQTDSLFKRVRPTEDFMRITLCGGAWKTHPSMFEQYRKEVTELYPAAVVRKPLFEHVCAGPARFLIENGMPREEAIRLMQTQFAEYRIDTGNE